MIHLIPALIAPFTFLFSIAATDAVLYVQSRSHLHIFISEIAMCKGTKQKKHQDKEQEAMPHVITSTRALQPFYAQATASPASAPPLNLQKNPESPDRTLTHLYQMFGLRPQAAARSSPSYHGISSPQKPTQHLHLQHHAAQTRSFNQLQHHQKLQQQLNHAQHIPLLQHMPKPTISNRLKAISVCAQGATGPRMPTPSFVDVPPNSVYLPVDEVRGKRQKLRERPGSTTCEYFEKFGWCQLGRSCAMHHEGGQSVLSNLCGLPIRPGVKVLFFFALRIHACRFSLLFTFSFALSTFCMMCNKDMLRSWCSYESCM
jgi:hypothetical protein